MLLSSMTVRRGRLPGTVTVVASVKMGSSLDEEEDDELDDEDELCDELDDELDDGGVLGSMAQMARVRRVHSCEK